MLSNHFKLAIRRLKKERLYSFLNIFGLTIGLTAFLLISLYVRDELSFDKLHENKDNIYRLVGEHPRLGVRSAIASDFVEYFSHDMPQVDSYTRLLGIDEKVLVGHDDERFNVSGVFFTDSNFFDFFSFKLIKGSSEMVFSNGGEAVLSESLVRKLFGDIDPIGKEIQIEKNEKYLITGISADNPANSTIQFELLLNKVGVLKNDFERMGGVQTVATYVSAIQGHSRESIVAHINESKSRPPYKIFTEKSDFDLIPLTDQRLNAPYESDFFEKNDVRYVRLFSGIGIVVLLLALINYVNLVTAQSIQRMKEVGLRKIIGAGRKELVVYQLVESILITVFSFLIAFGVAERLMPTFNTLLEKDITIEYFSFEFFSWVILAGLFLGLVSGIYPALYVSRVKPLILLQNGAGTGVKSKWLKKSLSLVQFTVTAILISVLTIMNGQMNFLKEKELGLDTSFVVEIPLRRDSTHLYSALKDQILTLSGVESASLNGFKLGGGWVSGVLDKPNIQGKGAKDVAEDMIRGDKDMIATLDMEFYWKADNYDPESFSEDQMMINYRLAEIMGWVDAPEGKRLYSYNDQVGKEVVGIVNDFHFKSLKEEVKPVFIYSLGSWGTDKLLVKLNGLEGLNEVERMRDVYQSLFDRPFEYAFLDDQLASFYKKEAGQFKLFQLFSFLAILISLLGLIALTTYMIAQRRKEVSIRKVLGASLQRLLFMLNREYSVLVLIAFLIASPIAYYLMEDWLSEFVYRITINPLLFMVGFLGFLGLSWLVTLFQSLRVSNENPADVLREE